MTEEAFITYDEIIQHQELQSRLDRRIEDVAIRYDTLQEEPKFRGWALANAHKFHLEGWEFLSGLGPTLDQISAHFQQSDQSGTVDIYIRFPATMLAHEDWHGDLIEAKAQRDEARIAVAVTEDVTKARRAASRQARERKLLAELKAKYEG